MNRKRQRDTSLVLRENAVGLITRGRYAISLSRFFLYCTAIFVSTEVLFVDGPATDYMISEYIQFLYENNLPMNWAGLLLSAVQDKYPVLRRQINGSWRSFAAWRRIEPAQRAKPIGIIVLQLLLHTLFAHATEQNVLQVFVIAIHILLIFCGLLRPSEARSLRWRDVTLEIHADGSCLVSIAVQGKTSGRKHIVEYLSIDDAFLFVLLTALKPFFTNDDFLWTFSQDFFGRFFPLLQKAANLRGYTPYSFKRGGATAHFATHRNYDQLCQLGRWSSLTAARLYVDDSMASLIRMQVPPHAQLSEVRRSLRALHRRLGGLESSAVLELRP